MSFRIFLLTLLFAISAAGCAGGDDDDDADDDVTDDDADDDDADDDDTADDDSIDDDTADDDSVDDDFVDDDSIDDDTADDDSIDDDSVDDDTTDDDTLDDDSVDDDAADDDTVDDDTTGPVFCYPDADWDDHGDDLPGAEFDDSCPPGWALTNDDCDDADPLTWPGAPELPGDGLVQNCGGVDLVPADNNGIFVSKAGNDANPGTMAAPKLTVAAAIAAAAQDGKVVYVSTGIYEECVTTSVSIFGGFDPVDWSRDVAAHDVLIIADSIHADRSVAVTVDADTPVALDTLGCHGGEGGETTVGVAVLGGVVELVDDWLYGGANEPLTTQSNGTYGLDALAGLVIVSGGTINGGWAQDSSLARACGILTEDGSRLVLWDSDVNGGFARPDTSGSGDCGSEGVLAYGTAFLHRNRITGGDAQSAGFTFSSGVTIYSADSLLTANTIAGGRAISTYSGEAFCSSSGGATTVGATTWFGNSISGGYANCLGEVYAVGAAPLGPSLVANNFIRAGEAEGVWPSSDGLHVNEATMINNVIVYADEGVSVVGSSLLVNNSIVGESNPESLGLYANHEIVLVNNYIANGMKFDNRWSEFTIVMQHNDVWGSDLACALFFVRTSECVETAEEINACTWWGCAGAAGNISEDPLFVDAANDDYHLSAESDCIDAGVDPAEWYDGELADYDFEDEARPQGDGWDIGADEFVN